MALTVGVAQPKYSLAGAVYWEGQDGNIWLRKADGTTSNLGDPQTAKVWDLGLNGATQIADPLPGGNQTAAPTSGTGTGGTGTSARVAPVLNQAGVNATQQAIDSLATEDTVGRQNIEAGYNSLMGKYDVEAQRATRDFEEGNQTNTDNLQKNKQNSLVAGAQGRRGLRGVLGSIGALFGDGSKLADRAVMESVNDDIGEAADTAKGNATTLTKAKTRFDEEDTVRRDEARTAKQNQTTEHERNLLTKRQKFLQEMAKLFGDAERTAEHDRFMGEAGGLNNEIAKRGGVAATAYTPKAAAFTPGELENYLAGAGDMTVQVAQGGTGAQGPTLLAGRGRKKAEEEELVAA